MESRITTSAKASVRFNDPLQIPPAKEIWHDVDVKVETAGTWCQMTIKQYPAFGSTGAYLAFKISIGELLSFASSDLTSSHKIHIQLLARIRAEIPHTGDKSEATSPWTNSSIRSFCTIPFKDLQCGTEIIIRLSKTEGAESRSHIQNLLIMMGTTSHDDVLDRAVNEVINDIVTEPIHRERYTSVALESETLASDESRRGTESLPSIATEPPMWLDLRGSFIPGSNYRDKQQRKNAQAYVQRSTGAGLHRSSKPNARAYRNTRAITRSTKSDPSGVREWSRFTEHNFRNQAGTRIDKLAAHADLRKGRIGAHPFGQQNIVKYGGQAQAVTSNGAHYGKTSSSTPAIAPSHHTDHGTTSNNQLQPETIRTHQQKVEKPTQHAEVTTSSKVSTSKDIIELKSSPLKKKRGGALFDVI